MNEVADIIKSLAPHVKTVTDQILKAFQVNFIQVYVTDLMPQLKAAVMRAYDNLVAIEDAEMPSRIKGKDPTALGNARSYFESVIVEELGAPASNGGSLTIGFMNRQKMGFDSDDPTHPLNSFKYYINGVTGEFAFITPEHYVTRRGRAHKGPLGDLGAGFLMSSTSYKEERWEEETGVAFSEVRHSISGQRPYTGFEEELNKFDYTGFFTKVVGMTTKSIDGTALG